MKTGTLKLDRDRLTAWCRLQNARKELKEAWKAYLAAELALRKRKCT